MGIALIRPLSTVVKLKSQAAEGITNPTLLILNPVFININPQSIKTLILNFPKPVKLTDNSASFSSDSRSVISYLILNFHIYISNK